MPVIGIDSPTGGLNAFDSVDNMPPTDAITLDNWIPRSGFCQSRPGESRFTTDLGAPVESLLAYKGIAERVMLAATGGQLLDVTAGGAGVLIDSGFANDRWQSTMINDVLVIVNGADPEQAFDGTTLTPLDYTGSDPAITPGEFIGTTIFKGRSIYWKKAGTSFWYAEAGSYQGELNEFPLGPVLQLGGNIVSIFTWTLDSGTGPDDMFCAVTDVGELILYQGDDPSNVGYFEQVGRFEMPDPLSIRGQMKYGSDVILMTSTGYVNLTTVLQTDQVSDYPAFSRKIARLVFPIGELYGANFGHECILSDLGVLIFNVPISDTESIQYVRNASTGMWCRFTEWSALTFLVFNDSLYWGGRDGYVHKVGGNSDNDLPISLTALPAYHYFEDPGNQKHLTAVQILSTHPDPKLIGVAGFADFDTPVLPNISAPSGGVGTKWNTSKWNTFKWTQTGVGQGVKTTKGWKNVSAFGYAVTVGVTMKIATQEIIWRQTGLRYNRAGAQ
jgi:hypothetical protein